MHLKNETYTITHHPEITPHFIAKWKKWNTTDNNGVIFQDPDWVLFKAEHDAQKEVLEVFSIAQKNTLLAVVPVFLSKGYLHCYLGEFSVLKFSLNHLQIVGGLNTVKLPPQQCEELLSLIKNTFKRFDTFHIEGLRKTSSMWQYLENSSHNKYFSFTPQEMAEYPTIDLTGSFDEYFNKFSRKARYNHNRTTKLLKKDFTVVLEKSTAPADVDSFVLQAHELSKKTYQYNLLKKGIQNPEKLGKHLKFIADNGWLRSYLLMCNNLPCAFMIGYQDTTTFYYVDVGFDPAMKKHSVGNVLQLMVLQDLFAENSPCTFEFGTYGEHKRFFSNSSYMAANTYIFEKSLSSHFYVTCHTIISSVSRTIVEILGKLNIKSTLKKAIRSFSAKS